MKCETIFSADRCLLTISGEVDVTSAAELTALEAQLAPASSVVIDVASLEYADTSFLRFLLRLKKHENKTERSSIRLTRVGRRLRRLLEITGLNRVFGCDEDAQAVHYLDEYRKSMPRARKYAASAARDSNTI